jgi:hypothetical protein
MAGNPVTKGQMTGHLADVCSYAPVTILIASYHDAAAGQLDAAASGWSAQEQPSARYPLLTTRQAEIRTTIPAGKEPSA